MEEIINVLLVEDSPTDALILKESLPETSSVHFTVTHVPNLGEGLSRLGQDRFDVVLLDLGLPDSQGLQTLSEMCSRSERIPILVVTGLEDEDLAFQAVRTGAQDFISKDSLQGSVLPRAVRYAVERNRLRDLWLGAHQGKRQRQELQALERLSKLSSAGLDHRDSGGESLQSRSPAAFREIVRVYEGILVESMQKRSYMTGSPSSEACRKLAEKLVSLKSVPRDVVEVHVAALKGKVAEIGSEKAQALVDEGRTTVLELMGYFASHYRDLAISLA